MALWTPSQISTVLWLDAADASTLYDATSGGSLVAADGTVARWQDKSGDGRHVIQSTAGFRPQRKTASQNGLDALLLDGNDWLEAASAAALPNTAKTIIAAVKSTNAVGGTIWSNQRATPSVATKYLVRLLRLGGINYVAGDFVAVNVTTSYDFSTEFQSPFIASWTENSSRATSLWTNGTSRSTSGTVAAETSITGFRIGSLLNTDGSIIQHWPGYFYEIVAVDAEVSTDVRQKIEGYLAHKWGTTSSLDSGHPYKTVAPSYGGSSPINGQSLIRPADSKPYQQLIGV